MKVFGIVLLCIVGAFASQVAKKGADGDFIHTILCKACDDLVAQVEAWLEQGNTEAEIIAKCDGWCDNLLHNNIMDAMCGMLIKEAVPDIIALLEKDEPADKVCGQIKLCSGSYKAPTVAKVAKVAPVQPRRDGDIIRTILCGVCTTLIQQVEGWLSSGQTEAQIIADVNNFCSDEMPFSWLASGCDDILDPLVPAIIQYINQNQSPATICNEISLCSSSEKPKALGINECTVCQMGIHFLEDELQNPNVQNAIQGDFGKLCKMLPAGQFQTICQMIDQEFPEIVQLLINKEPPQSVCTMIKMCTSKARKVASPRSNNFCAECVGVINLVKPYLGQAGAAAQRICAVVPAQYQSTCTQAINIAISEAQKGAQNPKAACSAIAQLTGQGSCAGISSLAALPKPRDIPQELECQACILLFQFVDQDLLSTDIETTVIGYIEKACALLPSPALQQQCDGIIQKYSDQLFAAIKAELDPNNVCGSILGLCSSKHH